jgi:hypothetical protein
MTEDPTPVQPEPEEQRSGKGIGCLYGGFAVIGSAIVGVVLAGFLAAIVPDSMDVLMAVIVVFLPIVVLVGAGIRWKGVPGFLLGIGLTFAISFAIFGACAVLIVSVA